jgi:hypothetical protein
VDLPTHISIGPLSQEPFRLCVSREPDLRPPDHPETFAEMRGSPSRLVARWIEWYALLLGAAQPRRVS